MGLTWAKRKVGPLPLWAWMGLVLGLLLAFASWRRSRQEAAAAADGVQQTYELPESIQPFYTNIFNPVNLATPSATPPGGGRPSTKPSVKPLPSVPRPPATQTPTPTPTPIPAPAAPKGQWVTVVGWKSNQPAGTPSTLWGMAEKVYGSGKGSMWPSIWNAPQNAAVRTKRGSADNIRAGDKFWVPQ